MGDISLLEFWGKAFESDKKMVKNGKKIAKNGKNC